MSESRVPPRMAPASQHTWSVHLCSILRSKFLLFFHTKMVSFLVPQPWPVTKAWADPAGHPKLFTPGALGQIQSLLYLDKRSPQSAMALTVAFRLPLKRYLLPAAKPRSSGQWMTFGFLRTSSHWRQLEAREAWQHR